MDGLLVFASCTVAGGAITAVTPAPGVTRAEAWRALGGLGTMAQQNVNAVGITGGTALLAGLTSNRVDVPNVAGSNVFGFVGNIVEAGGTSRFNLYLQGDAPNFINGRITIAGSTQLTTLGVQGIAQGNVGLNLHWSKAAQYGLLLHPTDTDSGNAAVLFTNVAQGAVGSILTTASATAYNTSSDVRLKHAIHAITGALARVQALRPVRFRWNVDDRQDEGFLAHELQQVLPHAVTGEPDAVDAQGQILPQQVDHSKIVPWLTAAVKELLARIEVLETQILALGG